MKLNTSLIRKDIIKKLNKLMLSQKDLTKEIDVSRSTLWRLKNQKELKVSTLLKIMEWLDADINDYIIKN